MFIIIFYDNKNLLSNCVIYLYFLNCTSAHQVDNLLSVAMGCVLGTEGTFVIYSYFIFIIINLYTDTYTFKQQMKLQTNFMKAYKEPRFNRIATMQFKKIIQTFYAVVLEHLQNVRYVVFIYFILFILYMYQT